MVVIFNSSLAKTDIFRKRSMNTMKELEGAKARSVPAGEEQKKHGGKARG